MSVYSTVVYIANWKNNVDYLQNLQGSLSMPDISIAGLALLLLCYSIALCIVILVNGLPKRLLILPVYYLTYYILWGFGVTLIAVLINGSLTVINKLASLDIVFFLINIMVALFHLWSAWKYDWWLCTTVGRDTV